MTQTSLFAPDTTEITPGRRLTARVGALFASAPDHFETTPVETLQLGFEGIPGDVHFGHTRRSGGREPWYPRGTEIRNERQLSIVAPDELAVVAGRMGLPEIRPEWIGANLVLHGIPQSIDAAFRHSAVLQGRRYGEDRCAERTMPRCWQTGRETGWHDGYRGRRAAVSEDCETPARAGRLGREAGRLDRWGGGLGARAGAVDLPTVGVSATSRSAAPTLHRHPDRAAAWRAIVSEPG